MTTPKATYKFIEFLIDPLEKYEGHDLYIILNKRAHKMMGNVFWYQSWKQWVARFEDDVVWSQDCLADLRDFIRSLPRVEEP